MTIWILIFLLLTVGALAGWRQGAIRAAVAFVGILLATLLAGLIGKIFNPLLPHLGASNPITAWAVAPILGFVAVSVAFVVAGQMVHQRVEIFYKYAAGDLRQSLWERLNTRVGICLGLLNGAAYAVLAGFLVFNFAYVTTQMSAGAKQSFWVRLANQLGSDLQATGFGQAANAVGTLPPKYYQMADLAGLLMQNPSAGPRLAEYPGLVSLWERDEMLALVQDSVLTNALASGATLGEILNAPSVSDFLKNKALTKSVWSIVETNYDDLTSYIQTGKSVKYDGEKIVGQWEFNPAVTIAWMRQDRPKMPVVELRALRVMVTQGYAKTRVLVAGDNKVFLKDLPKFKGDGNPELNTWKGDWTRSDAGYDLHVQFGSEEKFMSATADALRLSVKDGKTMLVFDRVN
jgi:hypothetical protein